MKSSTSVSSCPARSCRSGGGTRSLVRRQLATALRFAPAARELGAHLIGHAPRRDLDQPGARVVGTRRRAATARAAASSASCTASSRGGEVAVAPDDGAEHLRRELAQQVLAGRRPGSGSRFDGRRAHHLAHLDRHVQRLAAGAGRGRRRARRSRRRARASRRRRSSSRRGTPSTRGTGRRSPRAPPRAGAHDARLARAARAPRPRRTRPRRSGRVLRSFMNSMWACKSSGVQLATW